MVPPALGSPWTFASYCEGADLLSSFADSELGECLPEGSR